MKLAGPRQYEVSRKVVESDVISSFYLRPPDDKPLEAFRPGQFLTLDLVSSNGETVRRTYSLSCGPAVEDCYRISVKREANGVGSRILHDETEIGGHITIHDPKGEFVLSEDSERPVVLLSGGVGLTPMVSMLHALAEENRRDVYFVHACDSGNVHAFGEEVRALAKRSERILSHFCYREPGIDDVPGRDFDSEGFVTKDLLQQLLPLDDYDIYLCGPTIFMQRMYDLLSELGVKADRITYEFFGDGEPLERSAKIQAMDNGSTPEVALPQPTAISSDTPIVTFSASGVQVPWLGEHESILDLAEASGLSPAFSCRAGVCNTCECSLRVGELRYIQEPLCEPDQGRALICCSIPIGDVVLDL